MDQSPRKSAGPPRSVPRRTASGRQRARPRPPGEGSPFPNVGLYLLLFGTPALLGLVVVVAYVSRGREKPKPTAPVVREVDDYEKAMLLQEQAEPHIRGLFRAKRKGDKELVQAEFKKAQEKLFSARELLEGLKMRYTVDKTIDGELPSGFAYIDRDLERLQEKYYQIFKEVEY